MLLINIVSLRILCDIVYGHFYSWLGFPNESEKDKGATMSNIPNNWFLIKKGSHTWVCSEIYLQNFRLFYLAMKFTDFFFTQNKFYHKSCFWAIEMTSQPTDASSHSWHCSTGHSKLYISMPWSADHLVSLI